LVVPPAVSSALHLGTVSVHIAGRAAITHPKDVQALFVWSPEIRSALDGQIEVESSSGRIVV